MGNVNGKCAACGNAEAQGFFGNSEIWDPRPIQQSQNVDYILQAKKTGKQATIFSLINEDITMIFNSSYFRGRGRGSNSFTIMSPMDKKGRAR